MKRVLYFCLGLVGLLSLIASVAATQAANETLLREGFQQFSQTAHLNVPPSRYGFYAQALSRYLDGKADAVTVPDPADTSKSAPAFSDKENAHLRDVRRIISLLKALRWIGGGLAIAVLGGLYFGKKAQREQLLRDAVRGFAGASGLILLMAAALAIWGAVNFDGLFWAFHQVVFTNDLWLLNPQTDLLMALMPLPFFTWYAAQIFKALLPILGVMLLVIIACFRTKERP